MKIKSKFNIFKNFEIIILLIIFISFSLFSYFTGLIYSKFFFIAIPLIFLFYGYFRKALNNIDLCIYLLIITIPLSSMIYKTGVFVIEPWFIAFLVFLLVFLIRFGFQRKTLRIHIIAIFFIIFLTIALLSLIQAVNPARGSIRIVRLVMLLILFHILISVISKKNITNILKVFYLSVFFLCIIVFINLFLKIIKGESIGELERFTATFRNPAEFAGYLGLFFSILFGLYVTKYDEFNKLFYLIILILSFLSLLLIQSRSIFLAIFFGVFFYIGYKRFWKFALSTLVILLLIILIPNFNWLGGRILYKIVPEKYSEHLKFKASLSDAGHYYINSLMLNLIKEKPLTGVGIGNFQYHTTRYFNYKVFKGGGQRITVSQYGPAGRASHNSYLMTWVELGLFGFIFYLIIIFYTFFLLIVNIFRSPPDSKMRKLGMALLSGFITYNIFNYFHEFGIHEVRFWALISMCVVYTGFDKYEKASEKHIVL